jgi:hypothetical protein
LIALLPFDPVVLHPAARSAVTNVQAKAQRVRLGFIIDGSSFGFSDFFLLCFLLNRR